MDRYTIVPAFNTHVMALSELEAFRVNRMDELRRCLEAINVRQQNSLIFGSRGVGKTVIMPAISALALNYKDRFGSEQRNDRCN